MQHSDGSTESYDIQASGKNYVVAQQRESGKISYFRKGFDFDVAPLLADDTALQDKLKTDFRCIVYGSRELQQDDVDQCQDL